MSSTGGTTMDLSDTIVGVAAAATAIATIAALLWRGLGKLRGALAGPPPSETISHWRRELGVVDLEKDLEAEREARQRDQRANTMRFLKHMPWDERAEAALKQLGHDIGRPPPLLPTDGDLDVWHDAHPPAAEQRPPGSG